MSGSEQSLQLASRDGLRRDRQIAPRNLEVLATLNRPRRGVRTADRSGHLRGYAESSGPSGDDRPIRSLGVCGEPPEGVFIPLCWDYRRSMLNREDLSVGQFRGITDRNTCFILADTDYHDF